MAKVINNQIRRRRLVIVVVTLVFLFIVSYQFYPVRPTEKDLTTIREIIKRHTSESILSIEEQPNGVVVVQTGWIKGPLNGDGHYYRLRKILWSWWIYKSEHWAA
jgi:hypothetical protein